jgi:DNA-binding NarL/FixJ family response regulator
MVVGRSDECDLVVSHRSVSRKHAELSLSDDTLILTDLNSRNGTFIEQERIQTAAARAGQIVRFGHVAFLVSVHDPAHISHGADDTATADADEMSCVPGNPIMERLSVAQRNVFVLLVKGYPEKNIARKLRLSQHTVHNHISAMYRLLGVHTRAELLARVLSHNSTSA